jgi:hypothetical protein
MLLERRRHRVFVTRNSEYHCRDDVCVAVRDLATGEFFEYHRAIGRRRTGSVRVTECGEIAAFSPAHEEPHVGESLCFADARRVRELRTTELCAVRRPKLGMPEAAPTDPDLVTDRGTSSRER